MKKPFFFNSTNILVGIRFLARLMVFLIFMMFLTLYLTQPSSHKNLNPFVLPLYEGLLVISFYVVLIGLLVSWWLEGFGSFLTIFGLIAFSVLYYVLKSTVLWNVWILAIPSVLFLICWWFTNYAADYDVYRS